MIQYLRSINDVPVHVVGISTAAIIATLLREQQLPKVTLTAIAGLLDVEKGLHYDFDEEQLASFDSQGFCFKEFWLPPGSSSNPPDAVIPEVPEAAEEPWIKCAIPLSAAYREDFLTLNVARAAKTTGTPLLILHGDRDRSVPLENGEELFRAASEPKEMVLIKGGDHLLRSSKTVSHPLWAVAVEYAEAVNELLEGEHLQDSIHCFTKFEYIYRSFHKSFQRWKNHQQQHGNFTSKTVTSCTSKNGLA